MKLNAVWVRLMVVAILAGDCLHAVEQFLPLSYSVALAQAPTTPQVTPPERTEEPPLASPTPASVNELTIFRSVTYRPPQTKIAGRTAGAAMRSACPPPILLAPPLYVGLTTSSHPTFFWYQADAKPTNFLLIDEDTGESLYETTVLVIQPGIVQMKIPERVAALKVGKSYLWGISLVCLGQQASERDAFAQSWIQRIEPTATLTKELAMGAPGERPALYAAAGIWYDTLATLAALRRTYPKDLRVRQAWLDVLQAVALSKVATQPFAEQPLPPGNLPGTTPAGVRSPEVRPPALPAPVTPQPQPPPTPANSAPVEDR